MARRGTSRVGVKTVHLWGQALHSGASILDLGCGDGVPISQTLIEDGFQLYGVDASLSMTEAFHKRFPQVPISNEPVEESAFFNRQFDGVIAWGLMFLLLPEAQLDLICRVATVLVSGGRFLFTSPEQPCKWVDILTGLESASLGTDVYRRVADDVGLRLAAIDTDEGDNHYFSFVKT
jgi:2-polyprenyl-3-methyl-5-hydroxy-6-metoxy-1,4-benzoquinol methylase